MMELSQRQTAIPRASISTGSQESRLVIALVLLLVTLAAVLIKDRQFWFGSESTIADANETQPVAVPSTPAATEVAARPVTPASVPATSRVVKKQAVVVSTPAQPKPAEAPAVVTNRTVLPPLDVEVIAGDKHQNLHPGSNATKLQITKPAARATAPVVAPAVNAAQRERLAEAIPPSYPALAQHMNVQGSVILQALIGADGTIQNLRVLSGPAILATAAQQAVREWRFKPVFQNGQAVETRATITVNFSIKVADSSPNTTLADGRSDSLVISQQ